MSWDSTRTSGRRDDIFASLCLLSDYQADIDHRHEFIPNFSPKQVAIAANGIEQGVVYDENGVRVTAFRVNHANPNNPECLIVVQDF